jgi:hypothetical protein
LLVIFICWSVFVNRNMYLNCCLDPDYGYLLKLLSGFGSQQTFDMFRTCIRNPDPDNHLNLYLSRSEKFVRNFYLLDLELYTKYVFKIVAWIWIWDPDSLIPNIYSKIYRYISTTYLGILTTYSVLYLFFLLKCLYLFF